MDLTQEVSSTTEDEESDALGTFERAYTKVGRVPSPKNTDKAGFLERLSGRAYKDVKIKNSELHTKNSLLEKENIDLRTQLHQEKQKLQEQQRNLHAIMTDCSNIQLGDGNIIKIFEYDPDIADPIPLIRKLMRMMQDANGQVLHRLTVSENKLNNNNIYLQKIHSIVLQFRENGSSNAESQMMDQLKEMVDLPIENDDFSSIEKAFDSLKVDNSMKVLEHLPPPARRGIRFLVYKLGSMTRQAFANALNVSQWFGKQHRGYEEPLDDNTCSSIILHWLSTHENNVPKLMTILRDVDNQIINESMQNLKQETFEKVYDMLGERTIDQPETGAQILYQRAHRLGNSVMSLRSNRSDVSETLERIEKHVSETLEKTENNPLDTNALLCALYSLVMDNTKTLQAVSEKVGATDVYIDTYGGQKKSQNDKKSNADDQNRAKKEEEWTEEYV